MLLGFDLETQFSVDFHHDAVLQSVRNLAPLGWVGLGGSIVVGRTWTISTWTTTSVFHHFGELGLKRLGHEGVGHFAELRATASMDALKKRKGKPHDDGECGAVREAGGCGNEGNIRTEHGIE
jgi:hypothetical protein